MNSTTEMLEETMTDRQSERLELLARIDELDKLMKRTTDPEMIKVIEEQKEAIRDVLQNILIA